MRTRSGFVALPQFGQSVIAGILRRQPLSPGKVRMAWQLAAGPQLARAATAELEEPSTIRLHPKDPRWTVEIDRSRGALLARLRELLNLPTLELEVGGHSAPEPGTRNPEPGTRNPEPGTRNPEPGTRNLEPGTRNLEPGTRNLEPGTRNLEP